MSEVDSVASAPEVKVPFLGYFPEAASFKPDKNLLKLLELFGIKRQGMYDPILV